GPAGPSAGGSFSEKVCQTEKGLLRGFFVKGALGGAGGFFFCLGGVPAKRGRFFPLPRFRGGFGCGRCGGLPSCFFNAIAPNTFLRKLPLTIIVSSSAW